jgi:hypothetical protein
MKAKIFSIFLVIIVTVAVLFFKPALHKVVKFDKADITLNEKKLDTNTKENKIVWNKWHSNLANKVLAETKAPRGEDLDTVNIVEFYVDNNRNISNIKISTKPEKFTKLAQDNYGDYIRNLNGDKILQFPQDSERKVVFVRLPIVASTTRKFSTPDNFSDTETIKR